MDIVVSVTAESERRQSIFMIRVIFEDHERSNIAKLFRESFDREFSDSFIYARGCGEIKKRIEECLAEDCFIIVYLDVVVDNRDTVKTYRTLRANFGKTHRVMILPILCAEHRMLHSIADRVYLIQNEREIRAALDMDPEYQNEKIAQDNKIYCKTLERFCKLVLKKAVIDCVKDTPGADGSRVNSLYGYYYSLDCSCNAGNCDIDNVPLKQKSKELVRMYPAGSGMIFANISLDDSDRKELYEIHKGLIKQYNEKAEEFREHGYSTIKIQPFEDWSE